MSWKVAIDVIEQRTRKDAAGSYWKVTDGNTSSCASLSYLLRSSKGAMAARKSSNPFSGVISAYVRSLRQSGQLRAQPTILLQHLVKITGGLIREQQHIWHLNVSYRCLYRPGGSFIWFDIRRKLCRSFRISLTSNNTCDDTWTLGDQQGRFLLVDWKSSSLSESDMAIRLRGALCLTSSRMAYIFRLPAFQDLNP